MVLVKRNFIIGDEWLTFNIYGGYSFIDKLLSSVIHPMVLKLYDQQFISAFFFVRYNDIKGPHLRLRFCTESKNIQDVIHMANYNLGIYVENRSIREITLTTYCREIERYGNSNIVNIEKLFSCNSMDILNQLSKNSTERWIWGSETINEILTYFGLSLFDKHEIFESYYKSYEKEFSISRFTKEQLSQKYRLIGKDLLEVLKNEKQPKQRGNNYKKIIFDISENFIDNRSDLFNLLKSVIHMHYNRIFISKPRENELVLYYVLSKAYKTLSLTEKN